LWTGVAGLLEPAAAVAVATQRGNPGALSGLRAGLPLAAGAAGAAAAIRAALFAGAVRQTDAGSLGGAGRSRLARTAGAAAAVRSTLLARALGFAVGDAQPLAVAG